MTALSNSSAFESWVVQFRQLAVILHRSKLSHFYAKSTSRLDCPGLLPENLCDQWQDYDDYYDRLNHWIKTMESSLKAASDRKANLEQKTVQLEKQTVNECSSTDRGMKVVEGNKGCLI